MDHIDTKHIARKIGKVLFGLDNHANDILTKVVTYIEFQGAFHTPLVINLWGPTGSGKSQIIRLLVKELGLDEQYFILNAANSASEAWTEKLEWIAHSLGHRYRAQDEDENPGEEDGPSLDEMLMSLYSHGGPDWDGGGQRSQKRRLRRDRPSHGGGEQREKDHLGPETSEQGPINREKLLKRAQTRLEGAKLPVVLFIDEIQHARVISDRGGELFRGGVNDIWGILDEGIQYVTGERHPTIIFTAGNIELSAGEQVANWRGKYDKSDMQIHLSLHQIQIALSRRFRPEMIARLRTNHYYFGNITRRVAEMIIHRDLARFSNALTNGLEMEDVALEPELVGSLLDEFAMKGMGARGVESMVNQKITSHLHDWILSVAEQGHDLTEVRQMKIGGDAREILVTIGLACGKTIEIRYSIAAPKPPKTPVNPQLLTIQAIHEAGHAVTSYLLTGRAPKRLKVGIQDREYGGYVQFHNDDILPTKRSLFETLAINLAGCMAERLHFGPENISAGAVQDIKSAMRTANWKVFFAGMGKAIIRRDITELDTDNGPMFVVDLEDRREVESLLQAAQRLAERLLRSQPDAVRAIAKACYYKGSLNQSEMAELFRHWIDRGELERLRKSGDIILTTHAGLELPDDAKPERFNFLGQLFGEQAEESKSHALLLRSSGKKDDEDDEDDEDDKDHKGTKRGDEEKAEAERKAQREAFEVEYRRRLFPVRRGQSA